MNIRALEYIVAVADLGHFGRAASACHVSQPALSGQIRKLEDELGVVLFERTKRMVRVTPVGSGIVGHAREILALAGLIRETAAASRNPLSGSLRLGMIPTIGPYLTPLLLPSVARGLPAAEIDLFEDITPVLEQMLADGRIDAAIIATQPQDSRMAEIALYDEPFWVALPNRHPAALEDDVDLSDISREEFLLLADGHCLRDQVLSFCSDQLNGLPPVSTQNTSLTTTLALVGAGAGVTLAPAMSLAGSWVTDSGIALRREKSGLARRSVRLVHRRSFPRQALLDRLADIICAILPDTVHPERR